MKKITVLLAEDHTLVREGLRAILEMKDDFNVLGEATNGIQAVEMAISLRPAVVVLDIAMPKLNGFEAARRILQQVTPPPKILILSAHNDDAYVEQTSELGISGYLIKQASILDLVKAIKEVYSGRTFYSSSVSKRRNKLSHKNSAETGHPYKKDSRQLTSREREIIQLIAEGRSNKEVASDLSISVKTVEKHRQSAMDKLDIHDTAGLTRYAISAGMVESSVQSTIKQ